jgi:hemerythrin
MFSSPGTLLFEPIRKGPQMSTISDFNGASNADTEREHQVQLDLLQALFNAVREQRDSSSVAEILDQLMAYSEAHFLSEELLMRFKSYDDYEDHVNDHLCMLEMLQHIADGHAVGNSVLAGGEVEDLLGFITTHIQTRDRRFADFLRSGQ